VAVTSLQSSNRDGIDEAWHRWWYSLESIKSGLDLKLIWASAAFQLTDQDWLDGFEYFEECFRRGLKKGDEFTVCNRNQVRLAKFVVKNVGSRLKRTLIDFPSNSRGGSMDRITDKLRQKLINIVDDKMVQIGEGPVMILLDVSLKSWDQKLVLYAPTIAIRESLREAINQRFDPGIIAFVLFEREPSSKKMYDTFVIQNPHSTLAKSNPGLYRRAIEIFSDI